MCGGQVAFTTALPTLNPGIASCYSTVECSGEWSSINKIPTKEINDFLLKKICIKFIGVTLVKVSFYIQ